MTTLSPPKPTAVTRPTVLIPVPLAGADKKLLSEYAKLKERADVLDAERAAEAQHRASFMAGLDATANALTDKTNHDVITTHEIAQNARHIGDVAINLLRQELLIRGDLAEYMVRWREGCRAAIVVLRDKSDKTRAAVPKWLVGGGDHCGGFARRSQ